MRMNVGDCQMYNLCFAFNLAFNYKPKATNNKYLCLINVLSRLFSFSRKRYEFYYIQYLNLLGNSVTLSFFFSCFNCSILNKGIFYLITTAPSCGTWWSFFSLHLPPNYKGANKYYLPI